MGVLDAPAGTYLRVRERIGANELLGLDGINWEDSKNAPPIHSIWDYPSAVYYRGASEVAERYPCKAVAMHVCEQMRIVEGRSRTVRPQDVRNIIALHVAGERNLPIARALGLHKRIVILVVAQFARQVRRIHG